MRSMITHGHAAGRSGLPQAGWALQAGGIPVYELTERHASLEQAFMDITSGSVDYRASVPAPERTLIP